MISEIRSPAGATVGLVCVVNRSVSDSAQPQIKGRGIAMLRLLLAADIGLCLTLVMGFWSAMVLTSQEGDD